MKTEGALTRKFAKEIVLGELCSHPIYGLYLAVGRTEASLRWLLFSHSERNFQLVDDIPGTHLSFGVNWQLHIIRPQELRLGYRDHKLGQLGYVDGDIAIAVQDGHPSWGDVRFLNLSSFQFSNGMPDAICEDWVIWADENHLSMPEAEPLFRYLASEN